LSCVSAMAAWLSEKRVVGALDVAKHLRDEVAELVGFLATMHCCNILTLGGGQGDDLLPL